MRLIEAVGEEARGAVRCGEWTNTTIVRQLLSTITVPVQYCYTLAMLCGCADAARVAAAAESDTQQ